VAAVNPRLGAFQRLIEDQLEALPGLRFRRMFGGFGLYAHEHFFGLLSSRVRLYFHTSEQTCREYEKAGMSCFTAPGRKMALTRYFEVPASVIDSAALLVGWAATAIETVEAKKAAVPVRRRPAREGATGDAAPPAGAV
jgi:DNA transformation protein